VHTILGIIELLESPGKGGGDTNQLCYIRVSLNSNLIIGGSTSEVNGICGPHTYNPLHW